MVMNIKRVFKMVIERRHLFLHLRGVLAEVHMHGQELRYRDFSGVHPFAYTGGISVVNPTLSIG